MSYAIRFSVLTALVVVFIVAVAPAQTVKVGGYLQSWYLSQETPAVKNDPGIDSSDNGFRIRRARLNVKAELNDVFCIDSWFEFAGASNILLDFKGIAKIAPEFVVTVGQFIPPVQMNETVNIPSSNIPMYELSDIANYLADAMGTNSYRDMGLMLGGQYDVVKYGVFYGNGRGRFNSVATYPAAPSAGTILNRKFGQGLYGGRIDIEPVKGICVGGHYSINKQDSLLVSGSSPTNINRSSYSFNVGAQGFAPLPDLFADIEYANGKIKDGSGSDYNGVTATLGYKVIPLLQVLGRYDGMTQNCYAYGKTLASKLQVKNWTFGTTAFFCREKTELVKVGLNYEIRNESPTEIRNNILVLWTQFRF